MADRGEMWGLVADRDAMRVETSIGSIRHLGRLSQSMVSGNLASAALRAGVKGDGVGALGLASGDAYSVRLARDRMLIVSRESVALEPGWNDAGYAVTDMSAALEVFEIDGALADEIVCRATTLPVSGKSPSAAVSFAGVGAFVYRHRDGAAIRVHVDRSLTPFAWDWLQAVLALLLPAPASFKPLIRETVGMVRQPAAEDAFMGSLNGR